VLSVFFAVWGDIAAAKGDLGFYTIPMIISNLFV
jgi:hypothetical protein